MRKIFYLSTCSTCIRILNELKDYIHDFEIQDIKEKPVSESEIELFYNFYGSYESFFNKRAIKYRQLGLKTIIKTDSDYKKYLLQDYTFLKRPVFIIEDKVFSGNSKKVIEEIKSIL